MNRPYLPFVSPTPPALHTGGYSYVALRHPCRGYPYSSPATPSPPAPSALLPHPHPGSGGSACDSRWKAVPGSPPGSPHVVDRGGYHHGGGGSHGDSRWEAVPGSGYRADFPGRRGERSRTWFFSGIPPRALDRGDIVIGEETGYQYVPPRSPRPRRGGGTWGYPGKSVPGDANPRTVRNTIDDLLR